MSLSNGSGRIFSGFKGFNSDMTCREFQYAEGETYTQDANAACCEHGFHACEDPSDCFEYYPPYKSIYREVEVSGDISYSDSYNSTKFAGNTIKIGRILDIRTIVKKTLDFIGMRVSKYSSHAVAFAKTSFKAIAYVDKEYSIAATANKFCGHAVSNGAHSVSATTSCFSTSTSNNVRSAALSTAANSVAVVTGSDSCAVVTGNGSLANASGGKNIACALGSYCSAEADDPRSIAFSCGNNTHARGVKGSWLILAEEDDNGLTSSIKVFQVDNETVKENTWYTLTDGELTEWTPNNNPEEAIYCGTEPAKKHRNKEMFV